MERLPQESVRELERRRTFAIISHPDAGKTTLTEKLLLFGNAIEMAGVVKAKKNKIFATSDWMEIEKQRGISVTSSVMQFEYGGRAIVLLDTPGHADFSEDTYRVLTAVDSALMVIDAAKGIETQTRRLFQVCRDRNVPVMTFVNKMDRPGRESFDLIKEIEDGLNLPCAVMTWPIGQGDRFHGVYDRVAGGVRIFEPGLRTRGFDQVLTRDLSDPGLAVRVPAEFLERLKEDLELIEGAGHPYRRDDYLAGNLSPVFFGSALNNFGVQELLETFVAEAPSPLPRPAHERNVDPAERDFTAVVFKVQANMDPLHRDRTAFLRVCSGEFTPGMDVRHVRLGRSFRIGNALQFLSKERRHVERAVAGDIIGLNDRGLLIIGDTITQGENLNFIGIPRFSPDLFAEVDLKNPIKMKQLKKGLEQLAEEGSSQVFRRKDSSDTIVGVVGRLQFEVVKFRLLREYGADAVFTMLPYAGSRWYRCEDARELEAFENFYHANIVHDANGYPVMLFKSDWEANYVASKHPSVRFYSSLIGYERGEF